MTDGNSALASSTSTSASTSTAGTFLTRFLGSFRSPTSEQGSEEGSKGATQRPLLPRSLSNPLQSRPRPPADRRGSPSSIPASRHADHPASPLPASAQSSQSGSFSDEPDIRDVSSDLVAASGELSRPTSSGSGLGSAPSKQRFQPTFGRRTSTGTARDSRAHSPMASPFLSSDVPQPSPISPASTVRGGKERDPMDRTSWHDAPRVPRRGSSFSQRTLLPDGTPTLSASNSFPVLGPILEPEPSLSSTLDDPLGLVNSLIPMALVMLAQLGPSHLFSPAILPGHCSGGNFSAPFASPYVSSSAASRTTELPYPASDRASIASSVTSKTSSHDTSAMFGSTTSQGATPHSHELHAPSSVSLPAVSVAAFWRLLRGLERISGVQIKEPSNVNSRSTSNRDHELNLDSTRAAAGDANEHEAGSSFDFPSMLQGVADVLAATAAAKNIEIILGRMGQNKQPTSPSTPSMSNSDGVRKLAASATFDQRSESRECLVRGDESAWSIALIWILYDVVSRAPGGSSLCIRFQATPASSPSFGLSPMVEQPIEDATQANQVYIKTRLRSDQLWRVSTGIALVRGTPGSPAPFEAATTAFPADSSFTPRLDARKAQVILDHPDVKADLREVESFDANSSWVIEGVLSGGVPATSSSADEDTVFGRQRTASESHGVGCQEPTAEGLIRFARTSLQGLRVALHAGENSSFAKHLTHHLAGWGMDLTHIALDHDEAASTKNGRHKLDLSDHSNEPVNSPFRNLGRSDGFTLGGSGGGVPTDLATDPTSNLIVIDDDVTTLRRLLYTLRAPPLHYHHALPTKRPQLATRRTRSSPHVRQISQVPPTQTTWVIIHFASLTQYKTIKEVVQDALAHAKSPSLPDVLVIPKPAGPRRILTAFWTALKRPTVDPSLSPIATSPSAPGVQYWSPKLSPAVGGDEGAQDLASDRGEDNVSSSNASVRVHTPPTNGLPSSTPSGHPPSPLGKISDDQMSYFSGMAQNMDGVSPSEGVVFQSPNGRPAIFFQPSTRRVSNGKAHRDRDGSVSSVRSRQGSQNATTSPKIGDSFALASSSQAAPVATPHEIGLGHIRRSSSGSSTTSPKSESPHLIPIGTPALTLDSFILSAKSRAAGEDPSLMADPAANAPSAQPSDSLRRQGSSASLTTRRLTTPASSSIGVGGGAGSSSPRMGPSGVSAATARRVGSSTSSTSPSMSPSIGSASTALAGKVATLAPATPQTFHSSPTRRPTMNHSPKSRRRPSRKVTLPAVPPINVLIVEDNPINQMILSTFMKKKGIVYAVAKDGEEAVQKWRAGSFHLVLMDIQLPVKDGIEATREIREMERANDIGTFITTPTTDIASPISSASSSLPSSCSSPLIGSSISPLQLNMPVIIVALTASSLQADRVKALAAGCNDFLTKPVSLAWLEKKLREWGSMAYLSGFSAFPSDASSHSLRSSTLTTPATSRSLSETSKCSFVSGMSSKAAVISSQLHIAPKSAHTATSTPPNHGYGRRIYDSGSGSGSGGAGSEEHSDETMKSHPVQASATERKLPINSSEATPSEPSSPAAESSNPTVMVQAPTPEVDNTISTSLADDAAVSKGVPSVPTTIAEDSPPSRPTIDDQDSKAPVVNDETIATVDDKLRQLASAAQGSFEPSNDGPLLTTPSVLTSGRPGPSPLAQSTTASYEDNPSAPHAYEVSLPADSP
ncbi:BQ2448_3507 [Microbotryum intermedium]|uniref:BQ2448_3507 protein n=1 Tax=Microbotryum intermedium TaxID=269621 RepID=A0A238FC19_9BASI|nr:BQ2448_3507 [Microbotryum intermedium]